MAGNAVLNTVELLEQILLETECVDVILGQRVSRFWRSTIKKSTTLQTTTFARLKTASETWLQPLIVQSYAHDPLPLPLLVFLHILPVRITGSEVGVRQVSSALSGPSRTTVFNPFFRTAYKCPHTSGQRCERFRPKQSSLEDLHFCLPRLGESLQHCSARGSDMLRSMPLTQPATKAVVICS
jgi:hypothetical protein